MFLCYSVLRKLISRDSLYRIEALDISDFFMHLMATKREVSLCCASKTLPKAPQPNCLPVL